MTAIEIGLSVVGLLFLGLALLGLLRVERWLNARRARNDRADAAIEALLRERFEGAREVHGLTVPQLLDLVDIEIDLESDADFRRRTERLLDDLT